MKWAESVDVVGQKINKFNMEYYVGKLSDLFYLIGRARRFMASAVVVGV